MTLLSLASPLAAQTTTGSLRGRVTDSSKAAVQGASVTLTSETTGVSVTDPTTQSGEYAFPRIVPGPYRLVVARDGFKRQTFEDVEITVGEPVRLDSVLEVGAMQDVVTVQGAAGMAQRSSSEVSELIGGRRIQELPLNGRDFNKLLVLAPGVVVTPSSSAGSPAVAGARTPVNNYTIDGVPTNDERVDGLPPGAGFGSLGNAVPNIVSTEAIQEFRVVTSNADATYGRGSGAQITVVTKSGTNELRGSGYGFARNERLDARDFFNAGPYFNADGTSKNPPFRQQLYGTSLGGPIRKGRHFWFVSYEGFNQDRESTTPLTVLNADFINLMPGTLRDLYRAVFIDGSIIPAAGNPAGTFAPLSAADRAGAVARGYPAALFDGSTSNGEAGTVLVSGVSQANVDQHAFILKTDHHWSPAFSLRARYGQTRQRSLTGVVSDRIREPRRWQSLGLDGAYIAGSRQLVDFRLGVTRTRNYTYGAEPVTARIESLGINPQTGIFVSPGGTSTRTIRLRGESAFVNEQDPVTLSAQHTWALGPLTLRSGAELRHISLNFRSNIDIPTYSFFGFVGDTGLLPGASQAVAVADDAFATVFGATAGPKTPLRRYRAWQQEYYTQGDWRLRPSLTVNMGLRYSLFGVYTEADDALSNLYAVSNGSAVADVSPLTFGRTANAFAGVADGRPLYRSDRNNWQPRVGAAWDVGTHGWTVLRGAYGLYFDRIAILEFSDVVGNRPYAIAVDVAGAPFEPGRPLPIEEDETTGVAVDPALRNPRTARFNASIEQRVSRATTITVGYIGARARDLLRYDAINGGASVPQALRPDPRFTTESLLTNRSSSQYDALQIFARGRPLHGVDLTAGYTFAKSSDDVSAAFTFSGAGPALVNTGASAASGFQGGGALFVERPVWADVGRSGFDVRHQLVFSHLIDLPFGRGRRLLGGSGRLVNGLVGGWSLAGVGLVRSGMPFTVTLGADVNDDGARDDRPALLSGAAADLYARTGLQYLVPQAAARLLLGTPTPVTDPFAAMPRNAFTSPMVAVYDLSAIKRFPVKSRVSVQLELNAFNLFNHVNLAAPISDLSNVRFGQITSTLSGTHGSAGNPRQLQIGAKLTF